MENLSVKEVEDKKPVSRAPSAGESVNCQARGHFFYPPSTPPRQNCFELFIPDNKDQVIKACKTEADGRVVEGNHTFYRISAQTAEEKEEWMNSIK